MKTSKGLRIATRCESLEQFVAMFQKFVDEDSFFIATKDERPVGLEAAFSIQLADKTPVLRGTCVVLQVWATDANPFRHPGLRLGVKRLAASSIEVFERLLVTRKPRFTQAQAQAQTRTPGSEIVLPANPLADMSDRSLEAFVDCTLYEESAPEVDEVLEPPQASIVVDEMQLRPPEPPPPPKSEVAPTEAEPPPPPREPPRWDSTPLLAGSSTVPPLPRRRRARVVIAGAALGVAAIAVAVPFALATTADEDPPVRAAAVQVAPAVSLPAPEPEPPAAAPACKIDVASTPAGAAVALDGQPVGATPLSLTASCERHKLDVAHVRYQPVTRWVTPTADQASAIDLPLLRPMHQLAITTSPPGATIIIDGHRAGTTPATLEVPGFTVHKLAFVLRGFHTTTAARYSKVPHDRLSVQMAK